MSIQIRAVQNSATGGFVGEVTNINICAPLTREQVAAIERGMDDYAVLTFPGQPLTDEQQVAFTRNFGELEITLAGQMAKPEERRFQQLELGDISNYAKGDTTRLHKRADRARMYSLANRLWHSDASFRAVGAGYTLLHARITPSQGADTQFADMRAAYDALDDETKAEVEGMVCEHSRMFSRQLIGFTDFTDEERERFRPVRQCMVRTHPVTGRKSLYLASHAGEIVGWPMPEARAFLRDLIEHATQREFVYTHKWRVDDLVMWDNRQTMHRARPFPAHEPRDMRRTTLAGDGPTAEQVAA